MTYTVGATVRRKFDGLVGTVVTVAAGGTGQGPWLAVDFGREANDVWSGTLSAWEPVEDGDA